MIRSQKTPRRELPGRRPLARGLETLETRNLLATVVLETVDNDRLSTATAAPLEAGTTSILSGVADRRDRDFFTFRSPAAGIVTLQAASSQGAGVKVTVEDFRSEEILETEPHDGVHGGRFAVESGRTYSVRVRGLRAESVYEVSLDFVEATPDAASNLSPKPFRALDTNRDNSIGPVDALNVINFLNHVSPAEAEADIRSSDRLDVNDDSFVNPIDALSVINALNDAVHPADGAGNVEHAVDAIFAQVGANDRVGSDDPLNHDLNDDRVTGNDDSSSDGTGIDQSGSDDPVTHDSNDDRVTGIDDASPDSSGSSGSDEDEDQLDDDDLDDDLDDDHGDDHGDDHDDDHDDDHGDDHGDDHDEALGGDEHQGEEDGGNSGQGGDRSDDD